MSPLANGGAFGGKAHSVAPGAARELADRHGRPVLVLFSREDTVRLGPKRPPIAAGARADGTGVVHVVRTAGGGRSDPGRGARASRWSRSISPGPPTSVDLRGAGLGRGRRAAGRGDRCRHLDDHPDGGRAEAEITPEGAISVRVAGGDPLDEVVLASYATGAAHMALGWVTSEALAVDEAGTVHDLTIRSFGIPRAVDTPPIEIEIDTSAAETARPPVAVSDAVFAAVAAAVWRAQGHPPDWPTRRPLRI